MPTDKKQPQTNEQLIKVLSQLQDIFDKNVTKQDFLELGEALVLLIKDIQKSLDVKVTQNQEHIKSETERLGKEVASFEKRLREVIAETSGKTEKKLTEKVNELASLVGYMEENYKNYDDSELRAHLEMMKENMPMEYDPKDIIEDIEELEEKYKKLEKRIESMGKNVGGGVTNLRIQQAFKYILKTEAPVGDIDGVNTTYTVSQAIFAVLSFSLNGETIAQLPNYTIAGRTITFSTALPSAYSGKDFEIKYV